MGSFPETQIDPRLLLKPGMSYPEPAFHLVHGDEVVNRGSAFTIVILRNRTAGRRGRQHARDRAITSVVVIFT